MGGGPCDFSVTPSPVTGIWSFGLWMLDLGLTIDRNDELMNYQKDVFLTLTGSILYITVGILTVFNHNDKVLDQVTRSIMY